MSNEILAVVLVSKSSLEAAKFPVPLWFKLSITNFLLESRQGILDLKKANFKSAILNITPSSETTISGKVSNQQIHVIAE